MSVNAIAICHRVSFWEVLCWLYVKVAGGSSSWSWSWLLNCLSCFVTIFYATFGRTGGKTGATTQERVVNDENSKIFLQTIL